MNQVILRSSEVLDKENIASYVLERLFTYQPDAIVLEMISPTDLKLCNLFSKLTRFKTLPMLTIGHEKPKLLANMFAQAMEILDVDTIYIQTHQKANDAARMYLWEFLELIEHWKIQIRVMAPAAHFFEKEMCAYSLLLYAVDLKLQAHPCFVMSNAEESLAILDAGRFQKVLSEDPLAEIAIKLLLDNEIELDRLLKLQHPLHFFGLPAFGWFRENSQRKDGGQQYIPATVQAVAKIVRDRVSAWSDPRLTERTTRKFFIGQPDIQIVEILSGNIGKTVEGDYIRMDQFYIEKL